MVLVSAIKEHLVTIFHVTRFKLSNQRTSGSDLSYHQIQAATLQCCTGPEDDKVQLCPLGSSVVSEQNRFYPYCYLE
jgi:hypothetical protein